jgi:hypothetical protein
MSRYISHGDGAIGGHFSAISKKLEYLFFKNRTFHLGLPSPTGDWESEQQAMPPVTKGWFICQYRVTPQCPLCLKCPQRKLKFCFVGD